MSNNLDDDILDNLKEYNWEINNFEDLTQSDCNHTCSPTLDLVIKIEIDKVDLTKEEETHNEPFFLGKVYFVDFDLDVQIRGR